MRPLLSWWADWGRVRVGVAPALLPPIPTFPRQGEGDFKSRYLPSQLLVGEEGHHTRSLSAILKTNSSIRLRIHRRSLISGLAGRLRGKGL